ncbi:MAG: GAF domain-containing protein, partial [Gemmatimonadaceae bacterium]|nr:GAF domain-containing protein [Gemmatimonadaceae bacterium]
MQSPDKVLLPQLALLERGLRTTESLIAQMEPDSFTVVSATRRDTNFVTMERRYALGDTARVVAKLARVGGDTVVRGVDYRGVPVLASGQLVSGTPWIVVCRQDLASLRAEGRAFAIAAWSVAGVLILLVALGLRLMRLAAVRRSERQRYALASRYLAATTTSLDGSMLLAPDGRLLDVNESLSRITGYTKAELLSLTLTHLMQTVPAEEVQSWINELMSRRNAHFHSQWRRKEGTVIEVDISASHLPDADGGQLFCFVRDVTEQITTTRRLARLNTLYTFLNRVSKALFAAKTVQAAYEIVTRSALEDGRFRLCWIGVTDEPAGVVRPVAWAGSASAYVRELHITLDPSLPTSRGPTGLCVRNARAIVANDFARDARTQPWHALAEEHGLAASASLPVVVDGRVVAAVMFYASESHFFDDELLATLGEVSRLLGLVVQSVAAEERSREEAERRHLSEQRFRRLFESSPLPMFVLHEQTLLITRVNRAFTERFGYTLQDIPTFEIQQQRFYPDHETRAQLGDLFFEDIARTAESDAPVQSPDLRVCCKDGSYRDAQAFLSRAGDELVLGFVDVTEQRAMQATLQKAEEIAKLGSFSHDFTTNEFRTSSGFLEVLGFSAQVRDAHDDPNVPWLFNLFHPDDTAKMLAAFLHSKDVDETVRAAPDEGPQRHLRVRVHVEHDALGHPVQAVGSFQDVTDEVTARQELTRLRDHLQDVVDERTAELAKANATLQAADRRLKAMLSMSQKAATLDETAILQLGVDEAARLTGSAVGFLHLVTEDQEHLEFAAWSTGTMERCDCLYEVQTSVHSAQTWMQAVRHRTPVLVNAVDRTSLRACPTGHVSLQRFLAVPIPDGDRICLLLAVGDKAGDYDASDVQELELIGHDIWSVVQRRRADLALERAYARVKASDQRFAVAMDVSSEGVWEWDIQPGRLSFYDPDATMLGFAPSEMSTAVNEWVNYLHP